VWEITDPAIKRTIKGFAERSHLVRWSGYAERDIASTRGVTKQAVLDGILEHLACDYSVHADHMSNGDLAYIFHCFVVLGRLYVKLKFITLVPDAEEVMNIFSAHKDR